MNHTPGHPKDSHRLSIAVVCFFPDLGHIQPLLKIADALRERGHRITCYLPPDCRAAARRFDFDVDFLEGADLVETKRILSRTFARSLFFNAFSGYAHINLHQTPKVIQAGGASAERLVEHLIAGRPDVILADSYLFTDWYRALAEVTGVPLFLHQAGGSLAYRQRPYVRAYGPDTASEATMQAVETAGRMSAAICRRSVQAASPRLWLAGRRAKQDGQRRFAAAIAGRPRHPVSIRMISSGTAALEEDLLRGRLTAGTGDVRHVLPTRTRSPQALPQDLDSWLPGAGEPRALYVSFGSIVQIDAAFLAAVYEGLKRLDRKVVWSLPESQRGGLRRVTPSQAIRFETFVPQPELLAHPGIGGFVTQAGSSSVQEAILGATPMVCIPFFSDQPYNSAIVEQLGIGLRLWRRDITPERIHQAVATILDQPAYGTAIARLQERIARRDGGTDLADYVEDLCAAALLRP